MSGHPDRGITPRARLGADNAWRFPLSSSRARCAPRWMACLGYAAAALIATGVVVPLGLDIARLTNFAGYVSWCAWLMAMAIVLWRATRTVWVAIPGAVHGESSTVK